MFEIGDRVYALDWGCGVISAILENGALVTFKTRTRKGNYYFYFDELEKAD